MPRNRRKLTVEFLESRQLLSATTSAIEVPTPEWFTTLPRPAVPAQFATVPQNPIESITWEGQAGEMKRGEWIIQLSPSATAAATSPADVRNLLPAADFTVTVDKGLGLPGMVMLKTSASAARMEAWLADVPGLDSYSPNSISYTRRKPNDPLYGAQYALENDGISPSPLELPYTADSDIDAEAAWNITTGSSDVVVAVVDTGVDYTHEDLKDNMWHNPGEIPGNNRDDDKNGFVDDVYGYDFADEDADPMDFEGHGTSVAGTIGATGNNGIGISGINWDVSIMALKTAEVNGALNSSAIIRATNYITMMRLRGTNVVVSNHSYGGGPPSAAEERSVIAHRNANIVFVVAAGNDGANNDRIPDYPSNYGSDNIIVAAATGPSDELADFSNFGRNNVDIGAPGVQVLETALRNSYEPINGTSFSSPYTAGVVALVSAYAPTADFQELKRAVLEGGDPIPSLTFTTTTGNRLNAHGALLAMRQIKPAVAGVSGGGTAITNGDATPTETDGTDFGGLNVSNGRATHTFTVANVGGVPLELDDITLGGAGAADYIVVQAPSASITGGQSTTFAISFDPSAPGVRAALVTIEFGNVGVHTFAIEGEGLAPPPAWQNPRLKYDVNNDGNVSGLDVLVIVNELNRTGARPLPPPVAGTSPPPYYDVSGDGALSALDSLQVINYINSRPATPAPVVALAADSSVQQLPTANRSADLLFSAAWEQAADDLAGTLGKPGRGVGRRS